MKDLQVQDAAGKWWPCCCKTDKEVVKFIRRGLPHRYRRMKGPCPFCGRPLS